MSSLNHGTVEAKTMVCLLNGACLWITLRIAVSYSDRVVLGFVNSLLPLMSSDNGFKPTVDNSSLKQARFPHIFQSVYFKVQRRGGSAPYSLWFPPHYFYRVKADQSIKEFPVSI